MSEEYLRPPVMPGNVSLDLLSTKGANLLELSWNAGQQVALDIGPDLVMSHSQTNAPPAILFESRGPDVAVEEEAAKRGELDPSTNPGAVRSPDAPPVNFNPLLTVALVAAAAWLFTRDA